MEVPLGKGERGGWDTPPDYYYAVVKNNSKLFGFPVSVLQGMSSNIINRSSLNGNEWSKINTASEKEKKTECAY